jgi:hypothetical protein
MTGQFPTAASLLEFAQLADGTRRSRRFNAGGKRVLEISNLSWLFTLKRHKSITIHKGRGIFTQRRRGAEVEVEFGGQLTVHQLVMAGKVSPRPFPLCVSAPPRHRVKNELHESRAPRSTGRSHPVEHPAHF